MALENEVKPGDMVIDVGCWQWPILAIAAAGLGARAVLATDADPLAVEVAAENMERNNVADTVTVRESFPPGGRPD